MPSVVLYGTTLAWSCEGLATDPLADLLASFGPRESTSEASVRFVLAPATADAAADPSTEGLAPSFFHGIVQAFATRGGFLLWDHASRVHVPRDGSPILAELVPARAEVISGSTSAMLQIALTLALRWSGLFHLHAAALVHPSGTSVLVAGASGAGKTTTTLALLESGYDYLGDDSLFLRRAPRGDGVEALAFPREFHVGPATLTAFPRLAELAGELTARGDKRPIDPRIAYPGRERASRRMARGATLALFPSVARAAETELASLSKADAFGHLLASSASLVVEGVARREDNLAVLRDLLDGSTCRELLLGRDALADPRSAIAERIERVLVRA